TENVAHGIEISAGCRAADRVCEREKAADGDLGQRRCALNRECRTQIAKRSSRQIQATAKIPRVSQPDLVDFTGAYDPNIAGVDVMLTPFELLIGPREVPATRLYSVGS